MKESTPELVGRVKCPRCGYVMPVWYEKNASADGIWVRCKGKHCKIMFRIKIEETK